MAEKRPIRSLFRDSRRIRREVDEEIAFHIEMRIAELIREGEDPQEARRRALRRFGDLEQTRTACYRSDRRRERQMRRREYLREVAGDLRHGLRQVRSRPGFALAVMVTLAVAIGATTAVFSVADHVLLRPLPYEKAERVVTLWETDRSQGLLKGKVAPGNFVEWWERSSSFESLGLAEPTGFDLTGDGPPRSVPSWSVSDGFFEALGVRPAAGRLFTQEEYGPEAPRVVMISHGLWQRRYGGDPAIVGGTIQVEFAPATVVGVLPPDLDYPGAKDLWTPKEWREGETRPALRVHGCGRATASRGEHLAGAGGYGSRGRGTGGGVSTDERHRRSQRCTLTRAGRRRCAAGAAGSAGRRELRSPHRVRERG